MITRSIALSTTYRQEFEHKRFKNSDGTPMRCRVNGRCQTWKTRPDDFKLPVKYGLKTCFYIDPINAHEWSIKQ